MANNTPQNSANPSLSTKEIKDSYERKNFQNLVDYFNAQNQMLNFKFMEIVTTGAVTNKTYAHGLGSVPQDIFVTKVTGGTATFNYGLFDSSNINITTNGAVRIRVFVGTYWNYQSTVANKNTDAQTYGTSSSATSSSGTSVVKSSNYTMKASDQLILANASSGAITITLPLVVAASGLGAYRIVKTDSTTNVVTVAVQSTASEYINNKGIVSLTLPAQGNSITLAPISTTWTTLSYNRAPTKTTFTSGSGTYTPPKGCLYIRVIMAGGGGSGGAGSSGGTGNAGSSSTFGTSFLLCNGGAGGSSAGGTDGSGGTATQTGSGASGIFLQGGAGNGGGTNAGNYLQGGGGGVNPFGGNGGGAQGNTTAVAASANTGGGGGGGSSTAGGATPSGGGGGAGGYLDVIISAANLSSSYAYSVGPGGAAKGSGIATGSAGGSGVIIIEEFYQ
jgi:hypothetical protein